MNLFNWKKDKTSPQIDRYLYNRLNADMNYCGLSPEIQRGFLFFLGASINVAINESPVELDEYFTNPEMERDTFIRISTSYSESTGNFQDYGDLNDGIFSETIYTACHIIFKLTGLDVTTIDNELRRVEISENEFVILLKSNINDTFKEQYSDQSFNLNICHNLAEDIFYRIGKHLLDKEYELDRSYEAGYAYFCMQSAMDANGMFFLLSSIYNSLSPLYQALISYPILNFAYPDALKANHIFSNTLQMFYSGIHPEIIQPIHNYHQFVYYVSQSAEFHPKWDFQNRNDSNQQIEVFLSALAIRQTEIIDLKLTFINNGEFMCPELINCKINANDLFENIIKGIIRKYNIYPAQSNPAIWNNLGDLIQYFCILYYETCLHAIVIEEIINDD